MKDPWDDSPREHEPGGKYATGQIGKSYREGESITITIDITANHYGFFEFRLCQTDDSMARVDQACFDKNLLRINNNNVEKIPPKTMKALDPLLNNYKYFLPNKNNGEFHVQAQLPAGVSCKFCILQWRYHAGNNFGQANNGRTCLGCSERQEEFYNCADIEIVNDGDRTAEIEMNNTEISTTTPNSAKNLIGSFTYSTIVLVIFSPAFFINLF